MFGRKLAYQLIDIVFVSVLFWDYRNELGLHSQYKFFGISVFLGVILAELEMINYNLTKDDDED